MSAAEKARFFSFGHFFLYSPKARGPREPFVEAKTIGHLRFAVKKDVSFIEWDQFQPVESRKTHAE